MEVHPSKNRYAGFILAAGCMPNVATAADITQIQEVTEPMIHMTQISPYSWYGESFSISYGKKQTATKYFDGSNIGIELTCSAPIAGVFRVSLVSSTGVEMGARSISYQGYTNVSWLNVPAGRYYFLFTKQSDPHITVTADQLAMFSW
ncbi:hypothetical protein H6A35_08120 [Collinsella tanakaei]|nr:hypothetical protein [Collinsella tanakaei]